MTDKLTDSEIVKALECCAESGDFTKTQDEICSPCPYCNCGDCTGLLKANALDLINRQKARIQQLELKVEARNKVLQSKIAEIEKLSHKCEDCAGCTSWKCDCANIKSEAYKECIEKIKQRAECCSCSDAVNTIADNVLKNLEGKQNCE